MMRRRHVLSLWEMVRKMKTATCAALLCKRGRSMKQEDAPGDTGTIEKMGDCDKY